MFLDIHMIKASRFTDREVLKSWSRKSWLRPFTYMKPSDSKQEKRTGRSGKSKRKAYTKQTFGQNNGDHKRSETVQARFTILLIRPSTKNFFFSLRINYIARSSPSVRNQPRGRDTIKTSTVQVKNQCCPKIVRRHGHMSISKHSEPHWFFWKPSDNLLHYPTRSSQTAVLSWITTLIQLWRCSFTRVQYFSYTGREL